MILVVGSALDPAVHNLVDAWKGVGAALISARDLCTRGWVYDPAEPMQGTFVAGGVVHPVGGIQGVVVRRPAVISEELAWISEGDRGYVAAEINAFLVAWLSSLRCVVLNRPTPTSLYGPSWPQSHWRIATERAGFAWNEDGDSGRICSAVFCGQAAYGTQSGPQKRAGAELLRRSGAALLGVRFSDDAIVAVSPQPQLAEPAVRELILAHILEAGRP